MERRDTDWAGVRLHIVTGKGGTGKTTVAAALALALAADGGRVLLIEVEGRQAIAPLFDQPQLPYEERRIAVTPGGGEIFGQSIEPEQALLDYLEMFYKLGRAGKALKRFGAIDFATTIAPGLRDVLLTGKACEAARRRKDHKYVYDAVVMDAPPTGRITRFLNVNAEMAGLAKVGPIRGQADAVMRVISSPETAVHLVTLLEEMPVQETVDGVEDLRRANIPVGGIVVNQVRPEVLTQDVLADVTRSGSTRIADGLRAAGLTKARSANERKLVDGLTAEAAEYAQRVALEAEERTSLAVLDRPIYQLPLISEGIDIAALSRLAADLRDQGVA